MEYISNSLLGILYFTGVVNNLAAKSTVSFVEITDKNLAIVNNNLGISILSLFFDLFFDVAGLVDVNIPMCHVIAVVTFEGDSTVEAFVPIYSDCVVFIKCVDEVVCMFFANVFHTKVVDHKSETNGA